MSCHQTRGGEGPRPLLDANFVGNIWGQCKLTTCVCMC